jgi:hypothetical protein
MTREKPKSRKFLIKTNEGIAYADAEYFRELNRDLAVLIAINTYAELLNTMKIDGLDGSKSLFIGNQKLSIGLSNSIEELNNIFPGLFEEIRGVNRVFNGQCVFTC